MDLKLIKETLNSSLKNDIKEAIILSIIAEDDKAIPYLLKILNYERTQRKDLLNDTNLNLSRALIILDDKSMKKHTTFAVDEIKKHYIKWKHSVRCVFSTKDLP